ncbi:NAP-domain-containing protein [Serendipita vermifera]|nr:NAP-domain-containing protein [Serendipita vermifera]
MSNSSSSVPINAAGGPGSIAPTPQNTPLTTAPLATALSKPTVPTIGEGEEEDEEAAPPDTPPGAAGGAGALGALGSKGQSAILGLVQQRLQGLMGQSSGYIEGLPSGTQKRVLALKGVQTDYEKLQLQYKKECLELEKKYATLAKPLFDRRLEIISGKSLPTADELTKGHDQEVKDKEEWDDSDDEEEEDEEKIPTTLLPHEPIVDGEPGAEGGIPQFWLTTLRNHSGLSELITERDEKALEHLTDVRFEHLDPNTGEKKMGFKLIFIFDANPFFEQTTLEKTYHYQDELGYEGDFIFDRAYGTEITWKPDQDLTKEIEIKKQRNKHTNKTRLVRKARSVPSFFNFFTPPVPPSEEQLKNMEFEDEELEELDAKLELDYQIGEDLKEKIIPRAIDYFSGKALRYELDEDDYSDDDDEDDDEDDEDEENDDDDDEDEEPVPKRSAAKKGRKGDAGGTDPQECKQQ